MPSQVRRSKRQSGKKITGPTRYKHDLFVDPPIIRSRRSKVKSKKVPEVVKDPINDSDVDDAEGPIASKHPSKNYTKKELYDRWVQARTLASQYKQQVTETQKEIVKDKKELHKLYGELTNEREVVDGLQERVEDLLLELKEEKEKKKGQNNESEKSQVSNTERIANMRATFQSLTTKKEYEHKTVLCELQLKYDELNLHLKSKEDEVMRLREEVKDYKKHSCNFQELKVASLKSEIQVSTMRDKNSVR